MTHRILPVLDFTRFYRRLTYPFITLPTCLAYRTGYFSSLDQITEWILKVLWQVERRTSSMFATKLFPRVEFNNKIERKFQELLLSLVTSSRRNPQNFKVI